MTVAVALVGRKWVTPSHSIPSQTYQAKIQKGEEILLHGDFLTCHAGRVLFSEQVFGNPTFCNKIAQRQRSRLPRVRRTVKEENQRREEES